MADVLLVEDDADLRDLLADLLAFEGHEVRTAANGLEGLHRIDEQYPQLVISDVEMPVLGGVAMVYRMFIKNLGEENIPIILMSAGSLLGQIAENLGTPYWIEKPFDLDPLYDLVRRALREATPPCPRLAGSPSGRAAWSGGSLE